MNNTSKGLLTLVITLITTKIIQYFELGTFYYGLVYSALTELWKFIKCTEYASIFEKIQSTNYNLIFYVSIISVLIWRLYRILLYFYQSYETRTKPNMTTLIIYNGSIVKDIFEYIKLSPQCFSNITTFKLGDPKLISQICPDNSLSTNFEFMAPSYIDILRNNILRNNTQRSINKNLSTNFRFMTQAFTDIPLENPQIDINDNINLSIFQWNTSKCMGYKFKIIAKTIIGSHLGD